MLKQRVALETGGLIGPNLPSPNGVA
jgi:hypothetical protein